MEETPSRFDDQDDMATGLYNANQSAHSTAVPRALTADRPPARSAPIFGSHKPSKAAGGGGRVPRGMAMENAMTLFSKSMARITGAIA
jgi:hypothetical protein